MADISNTAVTTAPATGPGQGTCRPNTAGDPGPDGGDFAAALRSELRPAPAAPGDPAVDGPSHEAAESAEPDAAEVEEQPAVNPQLSPAVEVQADQAAAGGLAAAEAAGTAARAVESAPRSAEPGAAAPPEAARSQPHQGQGPTAAAARPVDRGGPVPGRTDGEPPPGTDEATIPPVAGGGSGPGPQGGASARGRTAGAVHLDETGADRAAGQAVRQGKPATGWGKAGEPGAAATAGDRAGEAPAAKATVDGRALADQAGDPITVKVLGPDGPGCGERPVSGDTTAGQLDRSPAGSVPDQPGNAVAEAGATPIQSPGGGPASVRFDPPAAAEARPAGPQNAPPAADQIISRARALVTPGVKAVEVQLQPAELGRVVLRVGQSGDGRLAAVIAAENAETATALRAKLDDLLSGLARQGLELSRVKITNGPVARGANSPSLDQGGAGGAANGFGKPLGGEGRGDSGNDPAGDGRGAAWLSDSRSITDAAGESPPPARAVARTGYARRLDLVA